MKEQVCPLLFLSYMLVCPSTFCLGKDSKKPFLLRGCQHHGLGFPSFQNCEPNKFLFFINYLVFGIIID
jgi:hypothetical protein